MSSESTPTKPSTAKAGWREAVERALREGEPTAKDAILALRETFEDVTEEAWDELPPNTNEGIHSAMAAPAHRNE